MHITTAFRARAFEGTVGAHCQAGPRPICRPMRTSYSQENNPDDSFSHFSGDRLFRVQQLAANPARSQGDHGHKIAWLQSRDIVFHAAGTADIYRDCRPLRAQMADRRGSSLGGGLRAVLRHADERLVRVNVHRARPRYRDLEQPDVLFIPYLSERTLPD